MLVLGNFGDLLFQRNVAVVVEDDLFHCGSRSTELIVTRDRFGGVRWGESRQLFGAHLVAGRIGHPDSAASDGGAKWIVNPRRNVALAQIRLSDLGCR